MTLVGRGGERDSLCLNLYQAHALERNASAETHDDHRDLASSPGTELAPGQWLSSGSVAISQDGRHVAYVAKSADVAPSSIDCILAAETTDALSASTGSNGSDARRQGTSGASNAVLLP